jgi:peptidoglycan/LPS O-acetylase OafA/YrhL
LLPPENKRDYRPEIDSLRAIAVLAVVLFHVRTGDGAAPLLPGGYLGVDVFFVISGYLITGLLLADISADRFSFPAFLRRRARRLLPALLAVLMATLVFGLILLLPADLDRLAMSALAALFFASNILFWREDSYLAPASAEKPLLHTWSLGIEEQYYLLFPLLLLGLWRFAKARLTLVLGLLFLTSLLAAQWASTDHAEAGFFLLPFRLWELLAGALLALPGSVHIVSPRWNSVAAWAGLGVIGASVALFDEQTRHPSLWTLLPILGTCLVIISARNKAAAGLLDRPALAYLGRLSYPLYLWHWPVFVFATLVLGAMTVWQFAVLTALSLILASATYHAIEKPVRAQTAPRYFGFAGLAATGAILVVSLVIIATNGLPSRLALQTEDVVRDNLEVDGQRCHEFGPCLFLKAGTPNYLLIGDSHAGAISGVVGRALIERGGYAQFTEGACIPMPGITNPARRPALVEDCKALAEQARDLITHSDPLTIIHLAHYNYWFNGPHGDNNGPVLDVVDGRSLHEAVSGQMLEWLEQGHRVVFILQPPDFEQHPLEWALAARSRAGRKPPELDRQALEARRGPVLEMLKDIQHPNFHVFDGTDAFCDPRSCRAVQDGAILYTDPDHLSREGAKRLWRGLEAFMDEISQTGTVPSP